MPSSLEVMNIQHNQLVDAHTHTHTHLLHTSVAMACPNSLSGLGGMHNQRVCQSARNPKIFDEPKASASKLRLQKGKCFLRLGARNSSGPHAVPITLFMESHKAREVVPMLSLQRFSLWRELIHAIAKIIAQRCAL